MKKKSLDDLTTRGQLSRAQMKTVTAGRPYPGEGDPGCNSCRCSGGAFARYDGMGHCYCPDDSSITCPF